MGDDHRHRNLERAQRVRSYRSDLKGRIAAGEVKLGEVLLARSAPDGRVDPDLVDGMKLRQLLEALPTIGEVKARALIARVGARSDTRLGRLTDRQRLELIDRAARRRFTR